MPFSEETRTIGLIFAAREFNSALLDPWLL
jgi:hypothetical protein